MGIRYFDELKVGDSVQTISRTLTETDLVNFISYMFQAEEIFSSVDYVMKSSPFKKRIVPGTLTLSLGVGLVSMTGWLKGATLALLGIDGVRFVKPVVVGDSIYCEATIAEKKPPTDANRGVIVVSHVIKNQDDQEVARFTTSRLIKRVPAQGA